MKCEKVKLSGADSSGIVFYNGKKYLRGISDNNIEIKKMFDDGFFQYMTLNKMIPQLNIYKGEIPQELKDYKLIIEQDAVTPITYPREWSFEMIKSAAIRYLEIADICLSYGYGIKDCHLFNFCF